LAVVPVAVDIISPPLLSQVESAHVRVPDLAIYLNLQELTSTQPVKTALAQGFAFPLFRFKGKLALLDGWSDESRLGALSQREKAPLTLR
jgi:hypothetical protein